MNQPRRISSYLLAWGLWVLSSASGVLIMFWGVYDAIRSVTEILTMGKLVQGSSAEQFQVPYTRNAVERFAVLTLGILSVLLVVGIEHFYRTSVGPRQIWQRFVGVTAVQLGVLFIALTTQSVVFAILGLITIWSVLVPIAVLVAVAALIWLLNRLSRRPTPT